MTERLIKSKKRVQQHGEVFTPKWMVDLMLDIPEVRQACETVHATFLEIKMRYRIQKLAQ